MRCLALSSVSGNWTSDPTVNNQWPSLQCEPALTVLVLRESALPEAPTPKVGGSQKGGSLARARMVAVSLCMGSATMAASLTDTSALTPAEPVAVRVERFGRIAPLERLRAGRATDATAVA